jgi:hypothetical protein
MIDFIDWVSFEKSDFKDGNVPAIVSKKGEKYEESQRKIFFLTDKEIFSSIPSEHSIVDPFFSEIMEEDLLSHKSIRDYFTNQGYVGLERGKELSLEDFWDVKKLPAVLASKLKSPEEFEKHWGKTFHSLFSFDNILYILKYAPERWKEFAWQEVLNRKTSLSELDKIIHCVDGEYPQGILEKIFYSFLPDDFSEETIPKKTILFFIKQPGWNKLCSLYLRNYCPKKHLSLIVVIAGSEKLRHKAWNKLIKCYLDLPDFIFMLKKFRELRRKKISEKWQGIIFEEFSTKDFSDGEIIELLDLISSTEVLRKISNNWNFSQEVMLEARKKLLLARGFEREVFGF